MDDDESTDVENELLLQDGRNDAEWLYLRVDGLLDLGGGHWLVEQ